MRKTCCWHSPDWSFTSFYFVFVCFSGASFGFCCSPARNKQKAVLFTNPLGKACYELNKERVTWIILVIWLFFPLGREISSWEIWWDLLSDDGFDGWARKCVFILIMFETLFVKVCSRYSSTGVGERPLRFLMFSWQIRWKPPTWRVWIIKIDKFRQGKTVRLNNKWHVTCLSSMSAWSFTLSTSFNPKARVWKERLHHFFCQTLAVQTSKENG